MKPYRSIVVDERASGRRVDVYLAARFRTLSRSAIARYVAEGQITSEDREVLKPSTTLSDGETLRIFVPGIAPTEAPPPLPTILYEDDRLLAFDKPAGLLCHPVGVEWAYGLIGLARTARPGVRLDLAHRLDRETSGVVVLTRDAGANVFVKEAFQGRRARKTYLAVVRGVPGWNERLVDAPIGSAEDSEIRIRQGVVASGAPARTRFVVVERMNELALVSCTPLTGRTHQLRVHLEHLGHPILGDKMYGHPDAVFLEHLDHGETDAVRAATCFSRHCLHAARLELPHPDGGLVEIAAPLPSDMLALVEGATPCWPAPGGAS